MKNRTLNNGVNIPELAFGTFGLDNSSESANIVYDAIKNGYRHIDTAYDYGSEIAVGLGVKKAIEDGIVNREDLFITTKQLSTEQGYDSTLKNFKDSLKNLGLDYVDCYLIHHPKYGDPNSQKYIIDSWRAFEKLYKEDKAKSIGVSNFQIYRLEALLKDAEIKPMINQIELHPQYQQTELVDFCKSNNILPCGWGTLNQGRIFSVKIVQEIAKKYNRSISQIAIKWSLSKGIVPIAFAEKEEYMVENLNIYDFELLDDDIRLLDSLNGKGEFSGWHVDKINESSKTNVKFVETIKLFHFIPIIKAKHTEAKTKYYLFGFFPILKITKNFV